MPFSALEKKNESLLSLLKSHTPYKDTQIKYDDNVWKCKILHKYGVIL